MNLNEVARKVTLAEGLKENLSIAQIKEVMRLLFEALNDYSDDDILHAVKRYRKP
jgi:hypothetical protein